MKIFKRFLKNSAVVIEIGNDWLKVWQVGRELSKVSVSKVNFLKLSLIKDSVADTIARIFQESKLNKNQVIMYIPRNLVTARVLELPSVNAQEIDNMVSLQASKQTPYSKEEVLTSHAVIKSSKEGYSKIMLVIARNNLIKERLEPLQKIGINIRQVGFSSEGVLIWFNRVYAAKLQAENLKHVALIDMDSNFSDFLVIQDKEIAYTKNILLGANNFLQDNEATAEKFIEEVKRTIEAYSEEYKTANLEKIFLSGAASLLKDLSAALSLKLGIPVEALSSEKDFELKDTSLQDNNFKSLSITPMIGFSMLQKGFKFDLFTKEMRIKNMVEQKRRDLFFTGFLTTSIIVVLSLLLLINIYNKNNYINNLKKQIALIKNDSEKIENMRRWASLIQERKSAKADILTSLSSIYNNAPANIYLNSINIERKKQALIRGRAQAISEVFKFVADLEKSPDFKEVKNNYTTAKKDESGDYVDFEITASYEE